MPSLRRIAVLVLSVGLVAGAWRPCAGWADSAEARMSCCTRKSACAKRHHGGDDSSARLAVSQSDADSCCAASERPQTDHPSVTVVPAPAVASVLAVFAEVPSVPRRWLDTGRPPPLLASRQLPRHLLLSVFVI